MISYDLFWFKLKIKTSTHGTNSMPFLIFWQDHLRSTSVIIVWDRLRPNLGIICGRGSFAVLYSSLSAFPLAGLCSSVILVPILVKCIDLVVNEMCMPYLVPPLSPGLLAH